MNGVIRYRLRPRQVLLYVVLMLVLVAPTATRPYPLRLLSLLSLVLWSGLVSLWWRRFGVELRPDALVVYGFRREAVPWTSIDRIERSTSLGTAYLNVHAGGRPWRLRAPQHTPFLSPDDEFEAKAETVMRTWEARRGQHWLVSA